MTKKRKSNHSKARTKLPLQPGECRTTIVGKKDGSSSRVTVEYQTHSRDDAGTIAGEISREMFGAARVVDLRTLSQQRPQDVIDGEILTPDGRLVVLRWIPIAGELLMLKARPSTMEDLATLDRYGEKSEEIEPRKAEARRVIAEYEAAQAESTQSTETPATAMQSILELAADA